MPKYYDLKIEIEDARQLYALMSSVEENNLTIEFNRRISDILRVHEDERKRLKGVRDANILFHVNRLVENTGTTTGFSDKEKLHLAEEIIRIHHIYVKSCRGEP